MGRWGGWTGVGAAAAAAGCLSELPELADPCAPWPEPGLYRVTIDPADGGDRRPYVYVPAGEGPRDIVVLLHGAGMSGPKIEEVTGFEDLADRDGFVVVYPNGLGWPTRLWNAGPQADRDQDDVAFLDALSGVVSDRVCGGRVLATGFSNGSMMAQRWGCQGKSPPDAVAGSSGPLLLDSCPGEPLPIRYYHGLEDPLVPYGGGTVRGVRIPAVEPAFENWRERNRCAPGEGDPVTRGDTTCTAWACDAPTELCTIDGWKHMWPGGVHSDLTDANATGAIWTWFDAVVPTGTTSEPQE